MRSSTLCWICAGANALALPWAFYELYVKHNPNADNYVAGGIIGIIMFPLLALAMRSTGD